MGSRIIARTAAAVPVVALVVPLILGGATGGTVAARAVAASRVAGLPGVSGRSGLAGLGGALDVAAPAAWRMTVARHYGDPDNASGYSAIVATGRDHAWAFGGTNPGGVSSPAAERWDGGRWQAWPLPAHLSGFIGDASAPSARDIWAVSYASGYVLHWDGARWRVARSWPRHAVLTGVTALGPRNVWVFGTTTAGIRGLGTWHFNGRSWTRAAGPAAEIYRASAVSRRDIWAVAADQRGGFVEHYDGSSWQRVRTGRLLAGTRLDDVLAVSSRDVWVIGNRESHQGDGPLLLAHFDGRRWTRTLTPWRADIGRLAPDGSGGIWITADNTGASDVLVGHLPRGGRLSWVTLQRGLGAGISDIAVNAGTSRVWLSGGFLTRAGGDAAIWSRGQVRATAAALGRAAIRAARSSAIIFRGRHQDLAALLDLGRPVALGRLSRRPDAD
jgi:hypothetical protein